MGDLKQLLSQRQHLAGLQAVLGSESNSPDAAGKSAPGHGGQDILEAWGPRAEHRGRAPTQQPQMQVQMHRPAASGDEAGSAVPAWYQRLRVQLAASKGGE